MVPHSWPTVRAYHRQIYIDLIRAYLADYGSQSALARALGLTEAYVSYLLEPVRPAGHGRRAEDWQSALGAQPHEVAEGLKYLKVPSESRARQIAEQLCKDDERREYLLHHIAIARRHKPLPSGSAQLSNDEIYAAVDAIGRVHSAAMHGLVPAETTLGYEDVWETARYVAGAIDPERNPVEYAQVLMFLHDAASVLGRQDLALDCARRATLVLTAKFDNATSEDRLARLRINALLAEVVSLNNLGLKADALQLTLRAERVRGYSMEPESWMRSFLEQRLTAMAGTARYSIYTAERVAERGIELVSGDPILQAGITHRLVNVYVAHATSRSRRLAAKSVAHLEAAIMGGIRMSPLREVQILRTLTRYYGWCGEIERTQTALMRCRRLAESANLSHQQDALTQEFT